MWKRGGRGTACRGEQQGGARVQHVEENSRGGRGTVCSGDVGCLLSTQEHNWPT